MAGIAVGDFIRAPLVAVSHARYLGSDTTSTVATGGSEKVLSWDMVQKSSPNVNAAGWPGNTMFTLLKSGIWFIEWCQRYRFVTNPTTGDSYVWAYRKSDGAQMAGYTTSSPVTHAVVCSGFTCRVFTAGDQIECRLRNSTNQIATVSNYPDLTHISFTFLQTA